MLRDPKRRPAHRWAAEALGRLGDRRARPALIQAMTRDRHEDVRFAATQALASLGHQGAIRRLRALANARPTTRRSRAAGRALRRLGIPSRPN